MRDDPDIRIEMSIDCDVFNNELASVGKSSTERNTKVLKEKFNKELNSLLSAKWDERIMNRTVTSLLSKKELSNFGCIQEIPFNKKYN